MFSKSSLSFHFETILSKHQCRFTSKQYFPKHPSRFTLILGGKAIFSKPPTRFTFIFSFPESRRHLFPQKNIFQSIEERKTSSQLKRFKILLKLLCDTSKSLIGVVLKKSFFINSFSLVGFAL